MGHDVPIVAWTIHEMIEQCSRDSARWFPKTSGSVPFMVLAMMGEAGEVANITKKIERGDTFFAVEQEHFMEELVDTMIYLCNVVGIVDGDAATGRWGEQFIRVWNEKRAKNEARFGPKEVRVKDEHETTHVPLRHLELDLGEGRKGEAVMGKVIPMGRPIRDDPQA